MEECSVGPYSIVVKQAGNLLLYQLESPTKLALIGVKQLSSQNHVTFPDSPSTLHSIPIVEVHEKHGRLMNWHA